jgi:hypothetical protein
LWGKGLAAFSGGGGRERVRTHTHVPKAFTFQPGVPIPSPATARVTNAMALTWPWLVSRGTKPVSSRNSAAMPKERQVAAFLTTTVDIHWRGGGKVHMQAIQRGRGVREG